MTTKAFGRNSRKRSRRAATSGSAISAYIEPTGAATGHLGTEGATIRIEPTGKVNVYVAGGSTGNSIETTVVQLTADALGVDIDDVATIQGDTAVTPFGAGTQGSRSGPMTAGAVNEAGDHPAGAHRGDGRAPPRSVAESDSRAGARPALVRGDPSKTVSFGELAYQRLLLSRSSCRRDVRRPGGDRAASTRRTPSIWANATHVCTCEVDVATGKVTLLRYIVSEDCGADDQPQRRRGPDRRRHGAGHRRRAAASTWPTTTTATRWPPRSWTTCCRRPPRCPPIEYGHVEIPGPGPGGYKGCGEGGAIGSPPAVINAVDDALAPLGVTITRLPATPASIAAVTDGRRRMKPAAFDYHRPDTVEQAVGLLAELGD